MNINEWIKSGIIESYVIGDLSEEEMLEVEEMALRHPEVQKELAQTEEALEGLAMKAGIKASDKVKAQIFQKIDEDFKQDVTISSTSSPKQVTLKQPESKAKIKLWQYWSAAASALLVLASVMAIYYRQQWQDTESELENYIAENQNLNQEFQALDRNFTQLKEQQEVFTDPAFTQVKLNGTDISPSAYALVYWNSDSEEVFLNPAGLPMPESGKQYQLWAIVDGKPQNAGIFNLQNELVGMQQIHNASAFAITLEQEGGSENPTLDAMYVIGEV